MVEEKAVQTTSTHLIILLIVAGLSTFFHLFGFGGYIALAYKDGQYGNQWVPFWYVALGLIIDLQSFYMIYKTWQNKQIERKIIWTIYSAWMLIQALMNIVADSIVSKNGEITGYNGTPSVWSSTWIFPLLTILNLVWIEKFNKNNTIRSAVDTLSLCIINEKESETKETHRPKKPSGWCNCRKCCSLKCVIKFIGWSSIGFISFFGFLLSLQTVWSAHDVLNYGPLGERIRIEMNSQMNLSNTAQIIGKGSMKMHILCKGPINNGSTFIFEAGAGSFSTSFFAIQDLLALNGRRSCVYDRAGYGWSDVLIAPTNSYQSVFNLYELLQAKGESQPYILVGHSVGGQLIQIYAALFPNQISGLAMLDSVPSFIYPLSLTGKPLNSNVTLSDLKPYLSLTTPIIDLFRAATAFGIHRWFQKASSDYQPAQLHNYVNAGYGKPLNWHAQYIDYKGTPDIIEILDQLSVHKYLNGFGWPTLNNSNTPVLSIIANSTAGGPDSLCPSSIDNSCTTTGRIGRAYYDGAYLQAKSLSNNSTFIVCDAPCTHSFVWTNKVEWLATTLLNKFAGV